MMNWGKSIFWVFVAFAVGIGYLVYRATQTQFELVEDDYYEQELSFQDQINQAQRAIDQHLTVKSWRGSEAAIIQIEGAKGPVSGGKVWFYDAQNRSNDRRFELQQSDSAQWEIPLTELAQSALHNATYELKCQWYMQGDTFRGTADWN
jgi:hypothetical protein